MRQNRNVSATSLAAISCRCCTLFLVALVAVAVSSGAACAGQWAAEFTTVSGSGGDVTSPYTGTTSGSFNCTYNGNLASNWLVGSGGAAVFNAQGVASRGRFATEHAISGPTGGSVGFRLQMDSTSIDRGPFQLCVLDGTTQYNCYVRYDNSTITILNNGGSAYSDPAPYSLSMTGYHNWCLAVKTGGDYAHWNLWIDGTRIAFSGSNGNHVYDGVTYSFRTPSNSYTGIPGPYIGLGELSNVLLNNWAFRYDWVRWQSEGLIYYGYPIVTTNPTSQTKCAGQSVTLSAAGTSSGTIGYQWQVYSGGAWNNISGATSANYTFNAASTAQYRCALANTSTSGTEDVVYTNAATVTVNPVPTAPSNPGATPITTSSITWTWQDNSTNETGFKVYADPGAGPPTTLRTTTAAGVVSWAYSGLTANTQYALQVAATSGSCDSAKTSNLAKYTLALPPVFGTSGDGRVNCDKGPGSSSTWYPDGTAITFTAVNGFGTGQAKASKYPYVWNTAAGAPSWTGASEWTSGTLVKSESASGSYYLHLRACNADGVPNTTSLTLGPYQIDADAPSTPVVTDDGEYTTSTTEIHASWTASAGASGIAEYQYAVSTSQTEAGIIAGGGWESTGTDTEATRTGLSLQYSETYYVLVKAKSGVGVWSAIGSSDGITVSDIGTVQPLGMPNAWIGGGDWFYDSGTNAGQKGVVGGVGLNTVSHLIRTWGKVTFAGSDYFYIDDGYGAEDGSGHTGIRVEATGLNIPDEDAYVVVTGISLLHTIGSELQPKVQVRRQADILVIE